MPFAVCCILHVMEGGGLLSRGVRVVLPCSCQSTQCGLEMRYLRLSENARDASHMTTVR